MAMTVFAVCAVLVIALLSTIGVFAGILFVAALRSRESYGALQEWKQRDL